MLSSLRYATGPLRRRLLALACLLIAARPASAAGDYIDPISKITAQDEALYSHSRSPWRAMAIG